MRCDVIAVLVRECGKLAALSVIVNRTCIAHSAFDLVSVEACRYSVMGLLDQSGEI